MHGLCKYEDNNDGVQASDQRRERVENTTANRRVIVCRVRSCIQTMMVQGLVERDGDGWKVTR